MEKTGCALGLRSQSEEKVINSGLNKHVLKTLKGKDKGLADGLHEYLREIMAPVSNKVLEIVLMLQQ